MFDHKPQIVRDWGWLNPAAGMFTNVMDLAKVWKRYRIISGFADQKALPAVADMSTFKRPRLYLV